MKTMSKHVIFALGALALLTACGGSGNSSGSTQETSASASSSQASHATSEAPSESSLPGPATSSESTQKKTYYTVTFDLGYEGKSFTQQVEEFHKATKPADPVRNGYDFLDWVDVNGDHWVFNGYSITEDITLYAKWSEPIEYTVTFVNNGGTVLDVQTGHYGDALVYGGETPVAEGQDPHYIYTFSGWDGELVITGDATLTATYETAYVATTAYYYDYDGTTLLATVSLAEGEKPHYDGETPTRERDKANQLQFEFEGWDKKEETADTIAFVARYSSCTDGLDIEGGTATYYHGTSTEVVVPSIWGGAKITKIGAKCFYGTSVTAVSIPSSVTSIGGSAFYNCSSLSSVTIPDSVTSIGGGAFSGCSSLSSVVIPDSVVSIGDSTFSYCSSLSSVVIPDSVTSIGAFAFSGCASLSSVVIPDGVTSIDSYAFSYCSSLSSVTIPDSVTSIGGSAFSYCSSLTSIVIPDSVTYIRPYAFENCAALTIFCECEYRPRDWDSTWSGGCVAIWGYRSSSSTDSLEYAVCDVDGEAYAVITAFLGSPSNAVIPSTVEGLPAKLSAASVLPLKSVLESIEIPDGVEVLGKLSFRDFPKLKTVVLPNSVTSIGDYAFAGCTSLSSVVIPDGVASIGGGAFQGCSSLSSIVIPDGVTSIGYSTFYDCSSLSSIAIPDSVTFIDDFAFSGCSSLSSVVIPDGVTSIGSGAFSGCSSLSSVFIPDSVTSIEAFAFTSCSALTIYCEAESKPSGWSSDWNSNNRPVVWGYKG